MAGGEYGSVSLRVDDEEITQFKEYAVSSDFTIPTDGFHFVVGDEVLSDRLLDLLMPGKTAQLYIDDAPQCTGYIDVVDPAGDRTVGNEIQIEGCDALSTVVRAQIDPSRRFPDKTPLEKLLIDTMKPFGFSSFLIDNSANVDVKAGKALNRPKRPSKKALSEYRMQHGKPNKEDTYFIFLSRLLTREGLMMWATADGKGIVVGKPDYDQPARYSLRRVRGGGGNNIIAGGVRRDGTDQPSFILATGDIPPSEHEVTRVHAYMDNGFADYAAKFHSSESAQAFIADYVGSKYTDTIVVTSKPVVQSNMFAPAVARPKFLHDPQSKTREQLSNFARRQMAAFMKRAVVGRYTIEGHRIDGQIIQVDTVVNIDDDRSRWHGPMWVLSRTFRKSRTGGTTTELTTIPLNSFIIGP